MKAFLILALACSFQTNPTAGEDVLSDAYRALWNAEVQARIDADIARYRQAEAVLPLEGVAPGTEVRIIQETHAFRFGANIFNFNQLGTTERNDRYKALFGMLFNAATIPFYWKTFEMEPGEPRFSGGDRDSEAFWNAQSDPKSQPHWRRPATDPIVAFLEEKGVWRHGHPIIWGTRKWHHPDWMLAECAPEPERKALEALGPDGGKTKSAAELAAMAPVTFQNMRRRFNERVAQMAAHYGDRIQSWDIVNESATDFKGTSETGDLVCPSPSYGLLPGDYTLHAFRAANQAFPPGVSLNINDYANNANYVAQVRDLLQRGCRISAVGTQMHLFRPEQTLGIAEGKDIETPERIRARMELLSQTGLPLYVSEITITAPGDDARGRAIQAAVARDQYRLWFSIEAMVGITWWNVVDDCGAPGEPTTSGLFTRDMQPKPSYEALNRLINHEWKTRVTVPVGDDGTVRFRGFKGRYRVSWTDPDGQRQERTFELRKDGDGARMLRVSAP